MKPRTLEHKLKLSLAAKERLKDKSKNTWYGKHLPEHLKAKLRERALRPERIAISIHNLPKYNKNEGPMLGKHHTEETKEKISKAHTGKKYTDELRKAMSERLKGKRPNISEAGWIAIKEGIKHRKVVFTSERRAAISKRLKGKKFTEEHKKRIVEARKHYKPSDETKKKIARSCKLLWLNSEYVAQQMKSRRVKPNRLEQQMDVWLRECSQGEWKYVGDGQVILGGKCPDWINVNGKKKIIELFGDYWHCNKSTQARIDKFAEFGFECLIIWEHELKDKKAVIEKIKEFEQV